MHAGMEDGGNGASIGALLLTGHHEMRAAAEAAAAGSDSKRTSLWLQYVIQIAWF